MPDRRRGATLVAVCLLLLYALVAGTFAVAQNARER
jgi:hypothetical protein